MPPTDEVDGGAPDLPNQNAMDIYTQNVCYPFIF
jgi:hypothetical protein